MKKVDKHLTVIEIASSSLRLIVLEDNKIIASTTLSIDYIHRGIYADSDKLTESIKQALYNINKNYLLQIKSVLVAISGQPLSSIITEASISIKNNKGIVNEKDIHDLTDKVENKIPESFLQNKKILHIIPQYYKIDGKKITSTNPIGLNAKVLEVKSLTILTNKDHLENILIAIEENGLDIEDVIVSHYAYSRKYIKENDKTAGVCVVNFGAETTSVITYDEGYPILFEVIPLGSADISRDLSLGFKILPSRAEMLKINKEYVLKKMSEELTEILTEKQKINQKKDQKDQREKANYLSLEERYFEIVYARLIDIFELILIHLKKINKDRLLPAGIIINGGGSITPDIDTIAREILNIPVSIIKENVCNKDIYKSKNNESICKVGIDTLSIYNTALYYLEKEKEDLHISHRNTKSQFSNILHNFWEWFKQFLP